MRLMVGLLYLKHAYNESDESVCERWAQDVYFQFFCGEEYFQPRLPCDPTNLVRFRQALGEAGVEELLAATIAAAVQMKAVTLVEFERVIVDTTVQEKAIAYPTDSRLLEVARARLVQLAQRAGLSDALKLAGKIFALMPLHRIPSYYPEPVLLRALTKHSDLFIGNILGMQSKRPLSAAKGQ